MKKLQASKMLGLAGFVVGVLSASTADASIHRGLSRSALAFSIKAADDPLAAAPQLTLPSLTQELEASEARRVAASQCVALCDLAATVEAHPFDRVALVPPNRPEGFTGHYWDKEASLYYAKARYYDPFTARFTQADSFLGNIDDPPSLHRYQYANANPTMFVDPTGHAADQVGYVYVLRGQDPVTGENISYTGSTTQELKKRFGSHKYRQLINAPGTRIDIEKVNADVDVNASGRGTMRSAKIEAVRSIEEVTRQRVAGEPARPLNAVKAATSENVARWAEIHKAEVGETFVLKRGEAALSPTKAATTIEEATTLTARTRSVGQGGTSVGVFTGFAIYDALRMAREQAMSQYAFAPYVLDDDGGPFTLQATRGFFSSKYEKQYLEGGRVVPIEKHEYLDLQGEAEALWGYVDWKGTWVPGKLRKELPVIKPKDGA